MSAKPPGPDEENIAIIHGVRLLDPLWSCSVAGSSKRDWKSAFLLALSLRYSRV